MVVRFINIRRSPGAGLRGSIAFGPHTFPCALGRSGISALKREGDGATPLATLALLYGYRKERRAPLPSHIRLFPIRADLGWCDEPLDGNYNRPVRLPYPTSHEIMRRADALYDICIVLDWNIRQRRRNRGSAIFLHIARPGFQPTEGCIAVSSAVMRRLLPHLSSRTRLRILR